MAADNSQLQLLLQSAFSNSHVPGASVAIIQGNKLVSTYYLGYANLEDKTPVTENTLFQVGSISKLFTALDVMILTQNHNLALHKNINPYLQKWQLNSPYKITTAQLLSMTGGVNVESFSGYRQGKKLPDTIEILKGVKPANSPRVKSIFPPGMKYYYSGGGYTILELAIQDITGQSFINFTHEHILKPLDMDHSLYTTTQSIRGNLAHGYLKKNKPVPNGWRVYASLGAAGLWSNTTDLAKLVIELMQSMNGRSSTILNQSNALKMLEKQPHSLYGLGLYLSGSGSNLNANKAGATQGFRSIILFYPHLGNGIVITTNANYGTPLLHKLTAIIQRYYQWPHIEATDPLS